MTSVTLLLSALLLGGQPARVVAPVAADTTPTPTSLISTSLTSPSDTVSRSDGVMLPLPTLAPTDTVRRRPKAVEVSDAYALRLKIHHYTAYTTIPLFVLQSVSGNQLYQTGGRDPAWASNVHNVSAAGLGAVFTVNTVTGLWNLWDSRGIEDGRVKRWLHSGLLLASDAGFTYAGVKLGSEARRSQSARDQHRRIAYVSMGTALVGYGLMLVGDH